MTPALIWLVIDGEGSLYGPFADLESVIWKLPHTVPRPLTLVEVENGKDSPVFLTIGDALCDAMDAIIFKKRGEKRTAFQERVKWAAGS